MARSESYSALKSAVLGHGYTHFYDLNKSSPASELLCGNALDRLYESLGPRGYTDILVV